MIEITGKILSRKCDGKWCTPEHDWEAEVQTIFAEVQKRLKGRQGSGKAVAKASDPSFDDSLNSGVLLASMFEAAGYRTKLRVMALRPGGAKDYSHAIACVQNPDSKEWFAADATKNEPLGTYPADKVSGSKDFEIE